MMESQLNSTDYEFNISNVPMLKTKRKTKLWKQAWKSIKKFDFFKWLIVFGSFLVYFIADGVSLSFGIFSREFIDHFKQDHNQSLIFLTNSLIQAVPLFLSPLVCFLIDKFSCRPIAFVGSTLLASSLILARFLVKDLLSLNLIMGIMTSFGLSMVYIPAYLIISFHFDKHRALATGLAVSGSGLGVFVLSRLAEKLIENYGWMDMCFLFGAISSHTFISACLFRSNEDSVLEKSKLEQEAENKIVNQIVSKNNQNFYFRFKFFLNEIRRIYKEKKFLIINLSYFILSFVVVAPFNFLPSQIKFREIDDPESFSISLMGISTLAGQIIIGFLSDIYRPYNWLIYSVCIMLAGVSTCFLPLLTNIRFIYFYSIIFGFTTSVNYVLQSTLVIESLGLANLTLAFGCLQLCQGFSTLVGSPFLGWVKDYTNSYDLVFYISGSVMTFAGLVLALWPLTEVNKKRKIKTNNFKTGPEFQNY